MELHAAEARKVYEKALFSTSKLTTQQILLIFWHFVHGLSESQCVTCSNITASYNNTAVKYYRMCREICNEWFWDPRNTPKLGGFGTIVEMDESYFAGKPKYQRGRRLGEKSWEDDQKWAFGLVQRNSMDAIIVQVPSKRSRNDLIPTIENNCKEGTIFCSDGWKAYHNLVEHMNLADCLHFPVNHTENYVHPETGAHTQTVEGMWRQVKAFLPNFGLKPGDLNTYIGTFLWLRYTKQRKLDKFIHFLACVKEKHPFKQF